MAASSNGYKEKVNNDNKIHDTLEFFMLVGQIKVCIHYLIQIL